MKKEIIITPSLTREWMSGGNASAPSGLITTLKKIVSVIVGISYNVLGFVALLVAWYFVSLITKGELPGPLATSVIFLELISDPFYDYGPNDKGIALQLLSSLIRVFTGFLLGSLIAIPVGLLMGANAFCRKVFYPVVQILKPVSPLAWFPIGLVAFQSASDATIFIIVITSLWPT
ncbi:MAG TPA: nitrate ABC transporter, permease protein, partial [Chryseolinea sp.]|nr:nitrate ABC transporter, permease protein [Chryseolinea sp.]